MRRLMVVALLAGLMSCLAMECPSGTVVPMGGGPGGGTIDQYTAARIITPTNNGDGTIGIGTYAIPADLEGETSYTMLLDGKSSCLSDPTRMRPAVNNAGELLVLARHTGDCATYDSYFVAVYPDATRLNGTQQPVRTAILEDPLSSFYGYVELAIDRERDVIYVVSPPPQVGGPKIWTIYVYEGTTTAGFDGVVAPSRTIMLPRNEEVHEIFYADNSLYYSFGGITRIPDIDQKSGELDSDDLEKNRDFTGLLALDSNSRVWLLRRNFEEPGVPDNGTLWRMKSDLSGADLEVLVGHSFPDSIRVDANGVVYINGVGTELRIYDDIESGTPGEILAPSRVVTSLLLYPETPYIIAE